MKKIIALVAIAFLSCNNNSSGEKTEPASASSNNLSGRWEGVFTNGMKETYISFDVSDDGKKLQNLEFKGYWRCNGQLELETIGPEGSFNIAGNNVAGTITEPENGGATAMRYELEAAFNGTKAEGSFRMNLNALGCDTYKLTWTAEKK